MQIDLSPQRFRSLLEELDIPNREAAEWCGVRESTLYRWLRGESPIPASAVRMFEAFQQLRRLGQMVEQAQPTLNSGGAENGV